MKKELLFLGLLSWTGLSAVEIPLDAITPVRMGYVDLQKVFDSYPEKSFAEGDLLREIEKRKRELGRKQSDINLMRQQLTLDQSALADARKGQAVIVPINTVPEPAPAVTPTVAASTSTVAASSGTIEAYPLEDPLAGLPGHEGALITETQNVANTALPGMKNKTRTLLDQLAEQGQAVTLTPEAQDALVKRIDVVQRQLDRAMVEFRTFRTNALADMKVLQNQKTYGVMAKIYAVLQTLARDENVMVVMDKAYVLYGEDAVDLSDKLIERLQGESRG